MHSDGIADPRQQRALVLAPFFSLDAPSRPRAAASVFAELMAVDIVTASFDHGRKIQREPKQSEKFQRVVYLKTLAYPSNTSVIRFVSHILFSIRAFAYFIQRRRDYDTVYVTLPFNLLAWLAFCCAGEKNKVLEVVDVWPDALPFPEATKRTFRPLFAAWKWLFIAATRKADFVISGSAVFLNEARRYTRQDAKTAQFYLSHDLLQAAVPKQEMFTVAYVGNLGHLYDFDTLLDVLSEQDLRQSIQMFVIGRGDRQQWLLRELVRREIRHRFFGPVLDAGQLAPILCSCHAGFNGYVRTTASFSYKAATYLAAGLPLINSMQGDLHDLVLDCHLGENYVAGDRHQLRMALLRLLQRNPEEVEGNCRKFFSDQLETTRVHEKLKHYLALNLGFPVGAVGSVENLVRG